MFNTLSSQGKVLWGFVIAFNILVLLWIIHAGVFVPGAAWIDARSFYIAGRCWLDGSSPYDYEVFRQHWIALLAGDTYYTPFLFPPTLALISIPIAILPWSIARWVISALNIGALLLIWTFVILLIKDHPHVRGKFLMLFAFMGLSGLVGAIPEDIFLAQKSIFAVCGCMGAIFFWRRNLPYLSGLFILIATFKPQISLLVLIYLLVTSNRSFKIRCFGFAVGCVAALFIFLLPPIPELISQLKTSYIAYREIPFNDASNYISILSIFRQFKDLMIVLFTLISIVFVCYLAWLRHYSHFFNSDEYAIPQADYLGHIQIIFAITLVFLPIREYDLCLLVPMIGTLPILFPRFWIPTTLIPLLILGRLNTINHIFSKLLGENWSDQHLHIISLLLAVLILGAFMIIWHIYRKPPIRRISFP